MSLSDLAWCAILAAIALIFLWPVAAVLSHFFGYKRPSLPEEPDVRHLEDEEVHDVLQEADTGFWLTVVWLLVFAALVAYLLLN